MSALWGSARNETGPLIKARINAVITVESKCTSILRAFANSEVVKLQTIR